MLSSKRSSKLNTFHSNEITDSMFLFVSLSHSSELPLELKGKLSPNAVLDKAQPMELDVDIEGPESIAISPNGNELYTGVVGGEIVRIDANGKVTFVAKFGQDCGKISFK